MQLHNCVKGGIVALGFLLFCAAASVLAQAPTAPLTQTFSSPQYGYSVDFPADWKPIPEADVKKMEDLVHKSSPAANVIWETSYQSPGGDHSFAYPYVILQVVPYPNGRQPRDSEIDTIIKQMTGENVKKMTASTGNKVFDEAMSHATVGGAQYDSTAHVAYQPVNLSLPGVGVVKGLITSHFGRGAMVSVMCYDRAGEIDDSKPTFSRINSSFQFDSHHAYDPAQAGIFGNFLGGAARGAITGGLIGALVAVVVWLIRRNKTRAA